MNRRRFVAGLLAEAVTPLTAAAQPTGKPARIGWLLAGMYPDCRYVEAEGLMSYGPRFAENFYRAAAFVDKILKGAKPGELPVEQPTRLELVINAKTAKALGMTIPRSLLLRADQVIE